MNKKAIILSSVGVAAMTIALAATLSIPKAISRPINAGAFVGEKTVLFTASSVTDKAYDDDSNPTYALFDLSAPVAFNKDDYTLDIKGIVLEGDSVSVGEDGHLFTATGNNWYFYLDDLEIVGTHEGLKNFNYMVSDGLGGYNVIKTRDYDYDGYDFIYDDETDTYLYDYIEEDRGSLQNPNIVIDAIAITYSCSL